MLKTFFFHRAIFTSPIFIIFFSQIMIPLIFSSSHTLLARCSQCKIYRYGPNGKRCLSHVFIIFDMFVQNKKSGVSSLYLA